MRSTPTYLLALWLGFPFALFFGIRALLPCPSRLVSRPHTVVVDPHDVAAAIRSTSAWSSPYFSVPTYPLPPPITHAYFKGGEVSVRPRLLPMALAFHPTRPPLSVMTHLDLPRVGIGRLGRIRHLLETAWAGGVSLAVRMPDEVEEREEGERVGEDDRDHDQGDTSHTRRMRVHLLDRLSAAGITPGPLLDRLEVSA